MCTGIKKFILLSLVLHLSVLAWASPVRSVPAAAGLPAARWQAVLVDLPVPAPPRAMTPPAARASRERTEDAAERAEEASALAPIAAEREIPAGGAANVPVRIVGNEDFTRMALMREMIAKTTSYYRSAPKGFEGVLRSALPFGALAEGGSAVVDIGILPSGEPGAVEIDSDSPALLAALRTVSWETAPLPARYRIRCSKVRLNVTVAGERLKVGVLVL